MIFIPFHRPCQAYYLHPDDGPTQGFYVVRENREHLPPDQLPVYHACSTVSPLGWIRKYVGLMYLLT